MIYFCACCQVLGLVCGIMMHDIDSNNTDFYQLPYHRILIMLFLELNAPEPVLESINLAVSPAISKLTTGYVAIRNCYKLLSTCTFTQLLFVEINMFDYL